LAERAAESLFTALFPADCRICAAPLVRISRLPVCDDCLDRMCPFEGVACSICGEAIPQTYAFADDAGEPRCTLCRRLGPPFARAAAYGSYDGGLRELIHLLKYERVKPAAGVLGRMLAEVILELQPSIEHKNVVVVPVPLHAKKLKQRGFNQAELIARAALKLAPGATQFEFAPALMARVRETSSQIGLTRRQRRENLRGAFVVAEPEKIVGQEVLLIDDVLTTGTTASECARILRRAGAVEVWVATVARTMKVQRTFALPGKLATEGPMALAAAKG
jgi:ComF family protein